MLILTNEALRSGTIGQGRSITVTITAATTVVATTATIAAVATSTTAATTAAAVSATAAATTTAATITATTTTASTRLARFGFVDGQSTTLEFTIMQRFDSRGGFLIAVHFDKAEASATSGFSVFENLCGNHAPILGEQLVEIGT